MKNISYLFITVVSVSCSHMHDKDISMGIIDCPYKKEDGTIGKGISVGAMSCDKKVD